LKVSRISLLIDSRQLSYFAYLDDKGTTLALRIGIKWLSIYFATINGINMLSPFTFNFNNCNDLYINGTD
jgi:hypothetical protein